MQEIVVYDLEGKPAGRTSLPNVFSTPVRTDLIRRAVIAQQTHRLQPKGRDPMAGKRTTAESYGVGRGVARVPRTKGERYAKAGAAAFAPSTVGGRITHPPAPEKKIRKNINRKERKLALQSAIAATAMKEIVSARGHAVEKVPSIPLVVSDSLSSISKTSEIKKAFVSLGLWQDIKRVINGRKPAPGSRRARRTREPKGPLIVVDEDKGIFKAARNIPGVEVAETKNLNPEILAPGTHHGRLTVWTESAIKKLNSEIRDD